MGVVGTRESIALPVSRDGLIMDFSRPFTNRNAINDLTPRLALGTRTLGASHGLV